jgi:hypothetical protein
VGATEPAWVELLAAVLVGARRPAVELQVGARLPEAVVHPRAGELPEAAGLPLAGVPLAAGLLLAGVPLAAGLRVVVLLRAAERLGVVRWGAPALPGWA